MSTLARHIYGDTASRSTEQALRNAAMLPHQPQPVYSTAYPAHILNTQHSSTEMRKDYELEELANTASQQYFELENSAASSEPSELEVWRRNANGPSRRNDAAAEGTSPVLLKFRFYSCCIWLFLCGSVTGLPVCSKRRVSSPHTFSSSTSSFSWHYHSTRSRSCNMALCSFH